MKLSLENNRFCFLIFAVVILIVFGNVLFNGFVYDDHYLIKDNPYIKDFSYLGKVLSSDVAVVSSIEKPSGYYRPLSMLFLMVMYKLWGLDIFGLHLMTILIHLANTFLVFLLIKKISANVRLGFIASLLFAVHPIHVEAVAPIFNFMGILATFFSLSAFLAFVKSRKEKDKRFFVLSVFLFFCAVFSKEEAITLPAVFILYDLYFVSNFNWKVLLGRIKEYLWFLLPAGLYVAVRLAVMQKPAALGFWNLDLGFSVSPAKTFFLQIISTAKIFFDYLVLLVFPFKLSAYYLLADPLLLSGLQIFLSVFIVSGLIAYAFYSAKKQKLISFSISFFFISSFMISNLIPIGGLFAERFMYFPSVFYCVLLAVFFLWLFDLCKKYQTALIRLIPLLLLIFVVGLYAQATAARNYVWRNDIILWFDTAKKTPQSYRPFQYLGDAYVYHGASYYEKALVAYREALKRPGAPEIELRNSIGRVYGVMNKHDLALKEFKYALSLDNGSIVGYYDIGITYYFMGEYEKALSFFKAGQALDKDYFWLYYGIGLVYEKQSRIAEAKEMFQIALALRPDFKMAHDVLERLK